MRTCPPQKEASIDDSRCIALVSYWNRIRQYKGHKDNLGVIKGNIGIELKSHLGPGVVLVQRRVDAATRGVPGFMLGLWSLIGVMSRFVWPPWDHLGATGSLGNLSWAAKSRRDHIWVWNHRWVTLEYVFVVGSPWWRAFVLGPSQDHGVA